MLVKRVREMERLPRGYAVAWWKENECAAVSLPVGLHVLASWVRARWLGLRAWHEPSIVERAFAAGLRQGMQNGHAAGERHGREIERLEREAAEAAEAQQREAICAALIELREAFAELRGQVH